MVSITLKTILSFCYFLFFCSNIFSQYWAAVPITDEHPKDYIAIIGETNINCFECEYDGNEGTQNIYQFVLNSESSRDQVLEVYIPVKEFNCSQYLMYDDLQLLLKSNEHPYIRIGIDPSQLRKIPNKPAVNLDISLTIADVTNIQSILCTVDDFKDSRLQISGQTTIHLTDYKIKPPVKFMGLVRVKDEVTISFSFNFIDS